MNRILFILCCVLFVLPVFSQDINGTLEKAMQTYEANPQEKIYLHLDKYSYTSGETIWLKAYATIGVQNLFSNYSKIGYIELIDPSEKVISSIKIPLVNGIGIGDFPLIDTLTEGSYRIRAYTNWMRNYDPTYFYDRTIQISNSRMDNVQTLSTVTSSEREDTYSITLKSLSGVPLSKTTVRYELIKDGEVVSQKRTATDEQGVMTVEVARKYEGALIKLRFENLEKMGVNKIIRPIKIGMPNSVQVFAEGGKIVSGAINNVAVKAINPKGLGVKATVLILAGSDTISTIETNGLGMGANFVFLSSDAQALKGVARFEDGTTMDVALPEIVPEGYSIIVNNQTKDRLACQVNVTKQFQDQKDLYFIVHHMGQVFFVSKQKANKSDLVFTSKKAELPNGVLTISILNSQMMPVVERAFFNYNEENRLAMKVLLNKQRFKTRDSVRVNIEIGRAQDSLRVAAMSASVVNLNKIQDDYKAEPNILTALLLSGDLKGFIEKPGYYFEESEIKAQELDNLMLTQGWRNIDWNTIGMQSSPGFAVENGIKISGYTKKLGRKAAEPNARVQLISTKNFMDYLDTVSNQDGYFEFDNILFPDSVKFLVSARTDKNKRNIDIIVDSKDKPATIFNPNAPLLKNDVNNQFVDQINQSKQYFAQLEQKGLMEKSIALEEVVVRASARKKVAENSSNLNGPGNADQVITADELSTCTTLEMCLAGRLMGVTWMNGEPYNTRGNVPMQVVLDGMFIEPEEVSMINVVDIESVEVLRNVNYTAIYGMNGGNGLLILTSKTGLSAMRSYVPRGILTIQPQGIYVTKSFYKPMYDVGDANPLGRDLRTTIHWEAGLVSNRQGKATFDFFTSDEAGKYLIILEGLDLNGRLGRELVEVEVK